MTAVRVGAVLLRLVATLLLVTVAAAGVVLVMLLGRRMQLLALLGLLTSLGLYHLWRRRADPRALPRGRRRRPSVTRALMSRQAVMSRHLR